jgi:dUTP pyrophosphatase
MSTVALGAAQVRFRRRTSTAKAPTKATPGSACWDIYADIPFRQVILEPGYSHAVPTGWEIEIPWGWTGLVFARSGLAARLQVHLANGVGVIDSDYRGELKILLEMTGLATGDDPRNTDFLTIRPGDRIAQILFLPLPPVEIIETDQSLSSTVRGEGGFGSTGVS